MSNSQFDVLHKALRCATEYLAGLEQMPVSANCDSHTLKARFGTGLPEQGTPASRVIDDLVEASYDGLVGSAGGRFFAWVAGGTLESALAADWLTSTWDQNAALFACSPAAATIEEVAGDWLKELLGLPLDASFAFTTGCQMAHFTCLAAARHALLRKAGWEVNDKGLCGAPQLHVLVSDQRHGSVDRAIRFLGLGNDNIVPIRTDHCGKIDVTAFADALLSHEGCPLIVVLNAADLNIAAFDPFEEIIPRAHEKGAWVHIDGAFGLIARASRSKRPLTAGLEMADSWATDGHKWLNTPFDCGFAFMRDQASHRESMTISASYLSMGGHFRDQMDWNPEWSRRGRGFAVYAALRELGRSGVEELVDRCCDHAHALVTGIGSLPGAEMLWEPHLNQGLVRFIDPRAGSMTADHDCHTDRIIDLINQTGEAFFSGTTWRGQRAMRVSVVNWRTSHEDVRRTIAAVRSVLEDCARQQDRAS